LTCLPWPCLATWQPSGHCQALFPNPHDKTAHAILSGVIQGYHMCCAGQELYLLRMSTCIISTIHSLRCSAFKHCPGNIYKLAEWPDANTVLKCKPTHSKNICVVIKSQMCIYEGACALLPSGCTITAVVVSVHVFPGSFYSESGSTCGFAQKKRNRTCISIDLGNPTRWRSSKHEVFITAEWKMLTMGSL